MKWLVDITIGYPNHKALDLQTIMTATRNPCQTTIHYRKFPISEVPTETEALTKWLNDRWIEKEKMLDIFYKTGKFPAYNDHTREVDENNLLEPRVVRLSYAKILMMYVVYGFLFYAMCVTISHGFSLVLDFLDILLIYLW